MPHGVASKKAAMWARIATAKRQAMRQAIIERDGTKCFHCGQPTRRPNGTNDPDQMTIDHWPTPKRELPRTEWLDPTRAVLACLGCNRALDYQAQIANRKVSA